MTGLILFIAAVNGAVDNKLTLTKSKESEVPFAYTYGYSFFFAVLSFLTQELNGICNIYWYIDYYRKYKYANNQGGKLRNQSQFQIPTIKVNDMDADGKYTHRSPQMNSSYRKQSSASSGTTSIGFFGKTGPRALKDIDPKPQTNNKPPVIFCFCFINKNNKNGIPSRG